MDPSQALPFVVVVSITLLIIAGYHILELHRDRRWLRHELRRALQAGAGSAGTQDHELAWRRAAMDVADVALVVTDASKRVLAMNPAAEAIFGTAPEGSSAIIALRHHTLEQLVDEVLRGTEPRPRTILFDGRDLRAEARPWPGRGSTQGALLAVRDLSEQQRLARARRDFIANVSHELRTPLASLKLLIETLQHGGLEDPTFGPRLVGRLESETEAMIRLVEDMTALALIESGRAHMRLAPASIAEIVAARVGRLAPLAELQDIRIVQQIPDGLVAPVDADRFGQVFTNLLDNALKYTPAGGQVTIRATLIDDVVRIEVVDTGPGIAPHDLPRIFERFYKSDTARDRSGAKEGGTGLGLAIARHIIEAHGARIWAESPPGRGAVFIIELPLVLPSPQQS